MRIFSIGHGARAFEELIATLASGGASAVVDVRRFPGSRRHPQFGREAFAQALAGAGVEYRWVEALGGRRRLGATSANPSWRVEAFRAYADYTDSAEFARGLDELLALAAKMPTAFLCAETHWSQCHRRIIADKLWSLGHEVIHLITPARAEPHHPPPFLRVDGARLRYDLPFDDGGQGSLV
ncbi:MAG TPA: DUF488 domain-containing protein [Polyangia bacterium]|nr:DUF488 domain-containing protein [Polyangia bacterium]